jgi:predicted nucleic acid-binding protein
MDPQDVLADACVVINLAASQIWDEVAEANGYRFVLSRKVTEESQYYYSVRPSGLERVKIDMQDLEARGRIKIEDPLPEELGSFVEYAQHLDDGEAETLAISVHRSIELATDDLGAIRFVDEQQLPVKLVRTSSMVYTWASRVNPNQSLLTEVLLRVSQGARFIPPKTAPHADWWVRNMSGEGPTA